MEVSEKIRVSTYFIFNKLMVLGLLVFCVFEYFKRRKTDDLYTEFYFLLALGLLWLLIYFFTRPKVYSDDFNFYFKKFNKPEVQVPFKDIHIIEKNPIWVKGEITYRMQYMDNNGKKDRILFYVDSYKRMQNLIELVKKENRFAKII